MNLKPRLGAAIACGLIALALPACSSPLSPVEAPMITVTAEPEPAADPAASTPPESAEPEGEVAVADLGPAVAQRSIKDADIGYTMEVHQPRRSGELVSLTVGVTVDSGDGVFSAQLLNDGGGASNVWPVGMRLADPVAGLLYLPATTEVGGRGLCSPSLPGMISAGDHYEFTCHFAGVPATLSTVTVTTPGFGEFANVAIG